MASMEEDKESVCLKEHAYNDMSDDDGVFSPHKKGMRVMMCTHSPRDAGLRVVVVVNHHWNDHSLLERIVSGVWFFDFAFNSIVLSDTFCLCIIYNYIYTNPL